MGLETLKSRMEATECDVTGTWRQSSGMQENGTTRLAHNARKSYWYGYIVSACQRREGTRREEASRLVNSFGLDALATEAWNNRRSALNYPTLEGPTQTLHPGPGLGYRSCLLRASRRQRRRVTICMCNQQSALSKTCIEMFMDPPCPCLCTERRWAKDLETKRA